MQAFAYFGWEPGHSIPHGGFCISVFAIMKKAGRVLVLKPKEHSRWAEEWAPNWRNYEPERLAGETRRWRFPSSYIRESEAPSDTLKRLMNDQLGIKRFTVRSNKLLNFYQRSSLHPGRMHWDYCFVYWVTTKETPKIQDWFSDMQYIKPKTLDAVNFGSSQGDLAEALNLL